MATQVSYPVQKNVAINPAISTVFFESQSLAYNYKTQQWSYLASGAGNVYFSVFGDDRALGQADNFNADFSWAVYDSNSTGSVDANASLKTGMFELNPGGRAVVDWTRPLADASAIEANYPLIGFRDIRTASETTATATSANTRTGRHHYRSAAVPPEGRYFTVEVQYGNENAATFTSIRGIEVEYSTSGDQ